MTNIGHPSLLGYMYVYTIQLYRIAFALAWKPYQTGFLVTHKNGDFDTISVTEQSCKVDSHVSDRCSHQCTRYLFMSTWKGIQYGGNITLADSQPNGHLDKTKLLLFSGNYYWTKSIIPEIFQASIVQTVNNAIHQINFHPEDSTTGFPYTILWKVIYQLDSAIYSVTFEQPGPGVHSFLIPYSPSYRMRAYRPSPGCSNNG